VSSQVILTLIIADFVLKILVTAILSSASLPALFDIGAGVAGLLLIFPFSVLQLWGGYDVYLDSLSRRAHLLVVFITANLTLLRGRNHAYYWNGQLVWDKCLSPDILYGAK
jgi:hypothetical protein